jgi:hypothetical protein
MRRQNWLATGAVALLGAATVATACAADAPDYVEQAEITCFAVSDLPADATRIDVSLKEWSIELSTDTVKAGNVGLVATNQGTMVHEMLVVRTDDPASLPYAANGSVNEDAISAADTLGEIAEFAVGTTCAHNFALSPGRYAVFCNIAEGDSVHLEKGMITTFTVTA